MGTEFTFFSGHRCALKKQFCSIFVYLILQSVTRVKPYICTMPLRLDEGWNQIQMNLADFTRRAYGTNYVETLRVQVHANCRLRRIYFSDRLYSEEELPPEFKLYLPMQVRNQITYSLAIKNLCFCSFSLVISSYSLFDISIAENITFTGRSFKLLTSEVTGCRFCMLYDYVSCLPVLSGFWFVSL